MELAAKIDVGFEFDYKKKSLGEVLAAKQLSVTGDIALVQPKKISFYKSDFGKPH